MCQMKRRKSELIRFLLFGPLLIFIIFYVFFNLIVESSDMLMNFILDYEKKKENKL